MSRCFPFPPPGYEKKLIPEDANILKKEKTKEKKHKDKKDKERREGKDEKDKEKSDRKHREKKDKKEKTKDKEKHKEKDKEKGSTSGEKRVSGQIENYNGSQSYQSEKERGKEKKESSSTLAEKTHIGEKYHQSEKERGKEKKESNSTSEDKRQIGQYDYCNGDKLHQKVEKSRDKRNTSNEKKLSVPIQGHTGGDKPVQHSFADKDSRDSKFLLEFSKRISDKETGSGSQLVEGFMEMDLKKVERTDIFTVRDTFVVAEGKEKIHLEEKFNGNAMSQNLTGSIQNKTGMCNLTDKLERRIDGKEKLKEKEIDDKRRDKRKSKHKDKQSQGKDKNCEKVKRKEDKAKKEHKQLEKDNLRSSDRDDNVGTPNNKTTHISKDTKNAATEGNLKKRKDIEKNGFLHEHVIRPEKMPRLDHYQSSENGQELELFKTITPQKQGEDKQELQIYNKDTMKNGLTGPHQLPISAPQPSSVIAEASRISPHPDMKYLSKVLSVPQVQEWSEVDDQAWLFNNKKSLLSKFEEDPSGVNQGQQVWAEALRIESADVFALPYVIPF